MDLQRRRSIRGLSSKCPARLFVLYSSYHTIRGAMFECQDVTTGMNNAGIGSGFKATEGWDPATGWGTPNLPAMLALAVGDD